jgi:DNA-binding response OmpR family regulator
MNHPGQTHSPEEIYANVWKETPYACRPIISVHVRHIREKIEADPSRPSHIILLWGQGYRYIA